MVWPSICVVAAETVESYTLLCYTYEKSEFYLDCKMGG